jgi:hypothetical protein
MAGPDDDGDGSGGDEQQDPPQEDPPRRLPRIIELDPDETTRNKPLQEGRSERQYGDGPGHDLQADQQAHDAELLVQAF